MSHPLNQKTYVCRHVAEAKEPVLTVFCDEDGDLQVLCDREQHGPADVVILAWGCALELDATLPGIDPLLGVGSVASRQGPDQPWVIEALQDEAAA
jgi:hypothetical protein